jgi:hypothetical protein
MGQSYLAIVDPSGLRALVPEDASGLQLYECVCPRLKNSAGFWAVLDNDDLPCLTSLLEQGDSHEALRVLGSRILDGGPLISDTPTA